VNNDCNRKYVRGYRERRIEIFPYTDQRKFETAYGIPSLLEKPSGEPAERDNLT